MPAVPSGKLTTWAAGKSYRSPGGQNALLEIVRQEYTVSPFCQSCGYFFIRRRQVALPPVIGKCYQRVGQPPVFKEIVPPFRQILLRSVAWFCAPFYDDLPLLFSGISSPVRLLFCQMLLLVLLFSSPILSALQFFVQIGNNR